MEPVPQPRMLWLLGAACLAWCAWVYGPWLVLPQSAQESSGFLSRVWDIQQQWTQHGIFPWWTANHMGGSSLALHHSQGWYVIPTLLLGTLVSLPMALKLTCLLSVVAATWAVFLCAQDFLQSRWAAALAAVTFLLSPQLLLKTMEVEHVAPITFLPFMPLMWMLLRRSLLVGGRKNMGLCALAAVGMLFAHNKQALVQLPFVLAYVIHYCFTTCDTWRVRLVRVATLGTLTLGMSVFLWWPALAEVSQARLFLGDPLDLWQRAMSTQSLLALVDRDGGITAAAHQGVVHALAQDVGQPQEAMGALGDMLREGGQQYLGAVVLVWIVVGLWRRPAVSQPASTALLGLGWLGATALAFGHDGMLPKHAQAVGALFALQGVPTWVRALGVLTPMVFLLTLTGVLRAAPLSRPAKAVWGLGLLGMIALPVFDLWDALPWLGSIRAPFVFQDFPGTFIVSLLSGAVLVRVTPLARQPAVVGLLALLMGLDMAPYRKAWKLAQVSPQRMEHVRDAYARVAQDPNAVRVYAVTNKHYHLLGPQWSGKPQAYEAFYNWMAPKGLGLLSHAEGAQQHLTLLSWLNAGYVLFEKPDAKPGQAVGSGLYDLYVASLTPVEENEHLALFHNAGAVGVANVYSSWAEYGGRLEESAAASLHWAQQGIPTLHTTRTLPPRESSAMRTPVTAARVGAHTLELDLKDAPPGLLVVSESYHPYWTATCDGLDVSVERASTMFLGVQTPPGAQKLVLHYKVPFSYVLAACLSVLCALGWWLARAPKDTMPSPLRDPMTLLPPPRPLA